jgi:hypothetical protein
VPCSQILDDGRVTDGQGRLVSFKNCLIIMTSNLGSAEVYRHTLQAQKKKAAAPLALQGQSSLPNGHPDGVDSAKDRDQIKELVMEQVVGGGMGQKHHSMRSAERQLWSCPQRHCAPISACSPLPAMPLHSGHCLTSLSSSVAIASTG